MKRRKSCLASFLATAMALTLMAPLASSAEAADKTMIPYGGTVLYNASDDMENLSKVADSFLETGVWNIDLSDGGSTTRMGEGDARNKGGMYFSYNYLPFADAFTDDAPDPYLTWQVAKESTVDFVLYTHTGSVENMEDKTLVRFYASEDNATWTEVTATKTEVTDANKEELALTDMHNAGGFQIFQYKYDMTGGNVFFKVAVDARNLKNNYTINIAKFRSTGGVAPAAAVAYDTEQSIVNDKDAVVAGFDSYSQDAFDFAQQFNDSSSGTEVKVPVLSLDYGYAKGKTSFDKPYVVYKVKGGTPFVATTAMFDKGVKMNFRFTLYTSKDKTAWTKADAVFKMQFTSLWDGYGIYTIDVPADHAYVKVEYPQEKDYAGTAFAYKKNEKADDGDGGLMHYVAALTNVKYTAYVDSPKPTEPKGPAIDTTIKFTGSEADLDKMAGSNKEGLDFTQKMGDQPAVMIKYEYAVGKSSFDPVYMTYRVAEKSPVEVKAYRHGRIKAMELDLRFFVSSDNKNWTEVTAAVVETEPAAKVGGFDYYVYTIENIPAGNTYLKVQFPQEKDYTGTTIDGDTINDPVNYGVAVMEISFAKFKNPGTGEAGTAVAAGAVTLLAAAVLVFSRRKKLSR